MPPLALAQLLHRALPHLSPLGRATVNFLVCFNGRIGCEPLCERLGLRNRYQLSRLLQGEGLPTFGELAGWVSLFHWVQRAETTGESLHKLAREAHMAPATSYRLVRRVAGIPWSMAKRVGTSGIVESFLRRCQVASTHTIRPHLRPRVQASLSQATRLPGRGGADRITLGGAPSGIAIAAGNVAYVTRPHAATVDRIDLVTGQVLGTIAVGGAPTQIVIDPRRRRAYVTLQFGDEIAVIDTEQNACVQSLPVPGDPVPVLVGAHGNILYVTTNEDRLHTICLDTGRILSSLRLPATSHHLAFDPATDRLYVATRVAGSVLEVNARNLRIAREFDLGGWPQGMVLSTRGARLYVANEKYGVDLISLTTGHRQAMLLESGGALEVALAPDDRTLCVGFIHSGMLAVIDAGSLKVRSRIAMGGRPRELAFDRAGRLAIVNEAGWMDVFPPRTV